ncbi:MAG TPA: hypothetical protein PKM84_03100, partial [Candidatus Pacearchaeota archaeon]|nr:hypothetical protein [Candidatus Pacearchaeota archaeon]
MNNFKRIFALLAVAICIPLFSYAQTIDTDTLIAQTEALQAQLAFPGQQNYIVSELLAAIRNLQAQLSACQGPALAGYSIILDSPTNNQNITYAPGMPPIVIKWHGNGVNNSGARAGFLEIIKVASENPTAGNKLYGTKIQRAVLLSGSYAWYPAQPGRYVINITPCKAVVNNICQHIDGANGAVTNVIVNKQGCSNFWTQAQACPQPANSDTNNAVDTVKYSVDSRWCAVAQCLGDQPITEPISEPTCSTVYKPRLMSSIASLSASKLGEGKATFRFTLIAPKERSIDISAFGMS